MEAVNDRSHFGRAFAGSGGAFRFPQLEHHSSHRMTLTERRRARRVQVRPYEVRVDRQEGYLVDLSEIGALVHLAHYQSPDRRFQVHLALEDEDFALTARVVWCVPYPIRLDAAVLMKHEYRVGLEFIDCPERDQLALRDFLARR